MAASPLNCGNAPSVVMQASKSSSALRCIASVLHAKPVLGACLRLGTGDRRTVADGNVPMVRGP